MILNKQIHVKEEYFHEFCETRSEGVNGMELSERIQRQRALPVLGPREEINVFVMIH